MRDMNFYWVLPVLLIALTLVTCVGMFMDYGNRVQECESKGGSYVDGKCLQIKTIPL